MNRKPLILLTNDDGVDAPGLEALYGPLSRLGQVVIVAPGKQCSATSHSVTVFEEMPYRRVERDGETWAHALEAMPADCVKLAVTHLLDRKPDLAISGINPGANLGNNILYSGTVAAAREAAMLGIPAMAVSVQRRPGPLTESPRYDVAAEFAANLARRILEGRSREGAGGRFFPRGTILNVNVPNLPREEIAGAIATRQGRTVFIDKMRPSGENGKIDSFMNVGDVLIRTTPESAEYDDIALEEKMISVTPLHFDMTHEEFRKEIGGWLDAPWEKPE